MFSGSLGSPFAIGQMLTTLTPLLIIGLGLSLAFRGRVYNIGAEGQLFMGALAGGTVLLEVSGNPSLMIALAMVAASPPAGCGRRSSASSARAGA
jgi:simple sugar transport system permease protein